MWACDFEYDGQNLSDYGFIICEPDGTNGFDTISAGSQITFNKVSRNRGKIHTLSGTSYDECITSTFKICKDPCVYDDIRISSDESRDIMRWLNRSKFYKFCFIPEDSWEETCFFNASFNVNKVVIAKELYAFELNMETDKPFGYAEEVSQSWTVTDADATCTLYDASDDVGYVYPSVVITCNESGDLSISNDLEDCTVIIKNCTVGEVITIDGDTRIVTSSLSGHKIYNDFNFEFLRIGNTFDCTENNLTVSIPCELTISYAPIVKDTPI